MPFLVSLKEQVILGTGSTVLRTTVGSQDSLKKGESALKTGPYNDSLLKGQIEERIVLSKDEVL